MTEQTDAADVSRHDVETQARVIDPEAFEDHPIEQRRPAAALQWSARRHIAREHAKRILASDWLAADRAAQRRLGAEEADSVRDAKFGNLRWLDGHQQGLKDGAEAVVAAIEAKAMGREPNMTFAVILDAARAAAQQVGGER